MEYVETIYSEHLRIDVLAVLPPFAERYRHLFVAWEKAHTYFPVAYLTLHGRIIEMIEVYGYKRRNGYATELMDRAHLWLGRKLVSGLEASPEGKAAVASGRRRGFIELTNEVDDEELDG